MAHYTRALLGHLAAAHPEDEWRAFVPGRAPVDVPPGVELVRSRAPSRAVFGAAALAGRPRLDRVVGASGGGAGGAASREAVDVVWLPAIAPVALSPGVPYVLTVHDLSFAERPGDFTRYERAWHALARPRRLAERAAAILTVSRATRDALVRRWSIDASRVHAVSPGIGWPATAAGPRPPGVPSRYLLAVGALEPRKAPDLLAQAHARARSRGLDADLVFAGHGRLASAVQGDGVHVLGHVSDGALAALYAHALALVMPSHLEGFGRPPLEALAHGTPPVVTDLPVFAETLGDAALRVAPGDADALADALLRIAGDAALRETLVAAGRARVDAYTWEDATARAHAILRAAAGPR